MLAMRVWAAILVLLGAALLATGRAPPPEADLKALAAAGVPSDGPGLVEFFRRRIAAVNDQDRINALIRQLGDDSYVVRERATAALVEIGLPAVPPLRQATSGTDVEIIRRAERCLQAIERVPTAALTAAAARAVARAAPAQAAEVLLQFLPHADDESVADALREAISQLALANEQPNPAVLKALDDPSPLRRSVAGEALTRAGRPDARRLMADPDPEVRLRVTLAVVGYGKDKAAVDGLIQLISEAPAAQAWRAEELLTRLAGDTAPGVSLGKDDVSRKRCRDAWAEWWNQRRTEIDLARLDTAPRSLGNTLIVQVDLASVLGRVFEVNPAGQVIWEIKNLQQPADAVIAGDDRVIIAEYSQNGTGMVGLRDFRGNLMWSKPAAQPIGLQALPRGGVLVVQRNLISEYDGAQAMVFQYQRDRFDLVAAAKDRNDEYVFITNSGPAGSQCVRIDRQRKELKSFPLNVGAGPGRLFMAGLEIQPNGRILVSHSGGFTEYDPDGGNRARTTIREASQLSSIQRLVNGNTLLAGFDHRRVAEVDRQGKIVWDYSSAEKGVPRKARRR